MNNNQSDIETARPGSFFRANPDVLAQRLDDVIVLVHLQTDRILELNRTAARLWELLGSGCNRSQIQQQMLQEFDVTEKQLTEEIDNCLSWLLAEDLVSVY